MAALFVRSTSKSCVDVKPRWVTELLVVTGQEVALPALLHSLFTSIKHAIEGVWFLQKYFCYMLMAHERSLNVMSIL